MPEIWGFDTDDDEGVGMEIEGSDDNCDSEDGGLDPACEMPLRRICSLEGVWPIALVRLQKGCKGAGVRNWRYMASLRRNARKPSWMATYTVMRTRMKQRIRLSYSRRLIDTKLDVACSVLSTAKTTTTKWW
jgi:hypothetical protein